MRVLSLLLLLSMSTLCAQELFKKRQDEVEVGDGITASTWRLTVHPHPGQLVMTAFVVEVGEAVEGEFDLTSRKVEMIHYVPRGDYVQDVGYKKYLNKEREVYDPRIYRKWKISGLGQNVTLGPMIHLGDGGGSAVAKILDQPGQRVSRRFRFSNSDEDFFNEGGSTFENRSRHIVVKFVVETALLDNAVAKAAEAGIDKLPELNGKPWSITLPQIEQPVEQDGADEPATAPESSPEGNDNAKTETERRPQ